MSLSSISWNLKNFGCLKQPVSFLTWLISSYAAHELRMLFCLKTTIPVLWLADCCLETKNGQKSFSPHVQHMSYKFQLIEPRDMRGCAIQIYLSHFETSQPKLFGETNPLSYSIQYAKANMTGCSIDTTCQICFGILYFQKSEYCYSYCIYLCTPAKWEMSLYRTTPAKWEMS